MKKEALVLIPARGGSKSIPGKNLAFIGNKPMIEFTIRSAMKANLPGVICLTTDDKRIRNFGLKLGIESPFLRPAELAQDDTGIIPVIKHTLEWYKTDRNFFPQMIVLLQPTNPFRTSRNIKEAYKLILKTGAKSLISVNYVNEHPCEYIIQKKNRFSYVVKPPKKPGRQNFPPVFFINGAIYITLTDYFEKTRKIYDREAVLYLMRKEESLDIDEKFELEYANFLYKKLKIK